jgi:hypothetical protein
MYAVPGELTQPGAEWRHIVAHQLNTFGYRDLTFDDIMAEHNDADLKKNESSITRSLRDGRTILIRRQPIKEGGWVATHEDITDRRKAEEQLSLIAHHDALTGLANCSLPAADAGGVSSAFRQPSNLRSYVSTSIILKKLTMLSAMPSGTACSGRWPLGSKRGSRGTIPSPGSAGTRSRSSRLEAHLELFVGQGTAKIDLELQARAIPRTPAKISSWVHATRQSLISEKCQRPLRFEGA